jgi:signal transduction histidine kinase
MAQARPSRPGQNGRSERSTGTDAGALPLDEDAVFDDLKIRTKLILLLAGPLLITLLLSALGARDRQASANESRAVDRLVSLSSANSDVVDALQVESLYSSAFVGSDRAGWSDELASARAATDAALGEALPRLDDLGGSSAAVTSSAGLAKGAADKLGFYRDSVDQGFRPDQLDELVVNYGQLQDAFVAVSTNVADSVSDPRAAADLRGASALASYKSTIATQGALLAGAGELGTMDEGATTVFDEARAKEQSQLELLNSISGLERKGAIRDAMATEASNAFEVVRDATAAVDAGDRLGFGGSEITGATATVVGDLHEVESALLGDLIADSRSATSSAANAARLFLIAAVISIAAAGLAALVLGRRITQPLRRLTEAADHLSGEQMPRLIETLKNPSEDELGFQIGALRPIDIDSNDEIGRLAHSFNEVQRVAGEVATEQAQLLRKGIGEMFVNLARRNQALLDRQIEFIDELERGEEDPDQLDNLYRLDHLATRMRRNAESLLVLAGAEPPRRRGRPAPLANVVRAALAEVEDFGRIELLSFDEVLVASNAAADLAHLLSELMENATNFSPPETRVEVVGHKTKADGYVISVTDHGIGMSADQILDANDSLARPPIVGLAMSRSLGFIVVGRLAARHSIAVRMMPSAAGGVTAVVSIPPSLVVDTPNGMAGAEPQFEAPARLKPVLESPTSGIPPMAFAGEASAPASSAGAPAAATDAPSTEPLTFTPIGGPNDAPGPVTWDPQPVASTEPSEPAASPPSVVDEGALPKRSIFDEPPVAVDAELAAGIDEAVGPAIPAALSFSAPVAEAPPIEAAPPRPNQGSRPFFLEDAAPARAFGETAPSAPAPAPTPPAPAAPRLFGGPVPGAAPAPEPAAAAPAVDAAPAPAPAPAVPPVAASSVAAPAAPEAPAAPAALPTRAPAGGASPSGGSHLDGPPPLAPRRPASAPPTAARPLPVPPIPGAAAPAAPEELPAADAAPQSPPAAPSTPAAAPAATTTTSGLAKRVPRSAGGSRAIPGSEAERGVGGSRRSPEEIRKMLAQHSAGRQRARVQEPVPAGAPEEEGTP